MNNWDKIAGMKREEQKKMQDKKLREFISGRLYPFSPYYRALFDKHKIKPEKIKTVKDLACVPFTSKTDFLPTKENPKVSRDFILQPSEELIKKYCGKPELLKLAAIKILKGKQYLEHRLTKEYRPLSLTLTTGTTNMPVSFFYSYHDIEALKAAGYRMMEVFGAKGYNKAVNLFPYAPHLAFWQVFFGGIQHEDFVLSTGGGKVMTTPNNVEAIMKIAPSFVIGEPSFVYHVIRYAHDNKKDFSFLKKVVLGANMVPPGFKRKIASLLSNMGAADVNILGTYGFTEAKYAWGECPTLIDVSSGYHTYPDMEIFEVIDPSTGRVLDEGEDGELVYTSINGRGSCVFRYRTGDLVKGGIIYAPCPHCGRTVPRISSNISRASNIKDMMLSK
ncbi:MAG: AMP-binding protein [Candidatus Margulisiibacteriota bacterium]|mgnify:CR=1 FL=1